jgi:prevent-host-death family protein
MRATAKDLRFYSKELIDTVLKGEEITITYRGKPIAKLVPLEKTKTVKGIKGELFGMWKDNNKVKDVQKYITSLRKGRFS